MVLIWTKLLALPFSVAVVSFCHNFSLLQFFFIAPKHVFTFFSTNQRTFGKLATMFRNVLQSLLQPMFVGFGVVLLLFLRCLMFQTPFETCSKHFQEVFHCPTLHLFSRSLDFGQLTALPFLGCHFRLFLLLSAIRGPNYKTRRVPAFNCKLRVQNFNSSVHFYFLFCMSSHREK